MRRMEDQVEQMKLRLEGYEKIEKELDDVVLQSAQSESEINTLTSLLSLPKPPPPVDHECDAERVLFSYGFGTSVPTNSRRRLQQRYIIIMVRSM